PEVRLDGEAHHRAGVAKNPEGRVNADRPERYSSVLGDADGNLGGERFGTQHRVQSGWKEHRLRMAVEPVADNTGHWRLIPMGGVIRHTLLVRTTWWGFIRGRLRVRLGL